MAEEFVNKANAAAFLSAYNEIDAQLRALYNFWSGQSFTGIVRRCAEKNAVVRRYEDELAEYARLRNAIVHQSTDGRVVAVPCDEVTREMERIASLLTEPPRNRDALPEKRWSASRRASRCGRRCCSFRGRGTPTSPFTTAGAWSAS